MSDASPIPNPEKSLPKDSSSENFLINFELLSFSVSSLKEDVKKLLSESVIKKNFTVAAKIRVSSLFLEEVSTLLDESLRILEENK